MKRRRLSGRIKRISRTTPEEKRSFQYEKVVKEMAESFRRRMKEQNDVNLTYSLDELDFLDKFFESLREKNEEETKETVLLLGCYFSELLRHNIGGSYEYDEVYNSLKLQCEGVSCFPLLHLKKALTTRETQTMQTFCFAFAKKVSDHQSE
ncbi:MAG: hypothetical protein N2234_09665 [Planctomycetota bacterium]|nr:hypothetical protein [Planctomycetota bacterium]